MNHSKMQCKELACCVAVRTVPGVGLYFAGLNYLQFLLCGSETPSSLQFMLLGQCKTIS